MRSAEIDDDVMAFLAERGRVTAVEFGKELGEQPLLEWGDGIQFQAITADGRPRIIIVREYTDWWRIRYQVAHEVFHWVCSPPQTHHWTHEMLAVEMAVRAMNEIGEHDYAQRSIDSLLEQAKLLPLETMLVTPLVSNDPPGLYSHPGIYGRAWLTGRQLSDAVGWELVKRLADSFGPDGKPSLRKWVLLLPASDRQKVEAVLGTPTPGWV
jgi:hypothetical protein